MDLGNIQIADLWLGQLRAKSAWVGDVQVWSDAPAYLCFTAEQANSSVRLEKQNTPGTGSSVPEISLEYSTDGSTWNDYTWSGSTGDTVTLAAVNDKVYIRAKTENSNLANGSSHWHQFFMSGKIAASGNIQTLLKADGSRTDVPMYCYANMFNGCTSLTTAPALPATTLAHGSYWSMFEGCTSLTTAPALPATTLASSCYYSMFKGCTSLTQAPALPATTLFSSSYSSMFKGCTSLTTAPVLPATTLDQSSYSSMFYGCTSLTTAPVLPATTLANSCYMSMFRECTSLTTAPALPAETLANYCYSYMFQNCSSLNSVEVRFSSWKSGATDNWLNGVAASGTFACPAELPDTRGASNIPEGWTKLVTPLIFTAAQANSTVRLDKVGYQADTIYLETSTDGTTWTDYSWSSNTGDTLTLANAGDKVYMRAKTENQTISKSSKGYYKFIMSGKIAASGNIQTLLKADGSRTDAPASCYYYMFYNCTSLTTAPQLPATTIDSYCYGYMFYGCTSLTVAPTILPATTLASNCYENMFRGCTALTAAPAISATTLGYWSCASMFYGCSSLTTAPELPATTLLVGSYDYMFTNCSSLSSIKVGISTWPSSSQGTENWVQGVAASGTFTCPAALADIRGNNRIPYGWTKVDAA